MSEGDCSVWPPMMVICLPPSRSVPASKDRLAAAILPASCCIVMP